MQQGARYFSLPRYVQAVQAVRGVREAETRNGRLATHATRRRGLKGSRVPMQVRSRPAEMSARSEPVTSYSAVERRRRDETDEILERLARNEVVDLPLCRIERVSA